MAVALEHLWGPRSILAMVSIQSCCTAPILTAGRVERIATF